MGLLFVMHNWVKALDDAPQMPDGVLLAIITLAYIAAPLVWWMAYYRLKAKQA